jgi:hypothetical protein
VYLIDDQLWKLDRRIVCVQALGEQEFETNLSEYHSEQTKKTRKGKEGGSNQLPTMIQAFTTFARKDY